MNNIEKVRHKGYYFTFQRSRGNCARLVSCIGGNLIKSCRIIPAAIVREPNLPYGTSSFVFVTTVCVSERIMLYPNHARHKSLVLARARPSRQGLQPTRRSVNGTIQRPENGLNNPFAFGCAEFVYLYQLAFKGILLLRKYTPP